MICWEPCSQTSAPWQTSVYLYLSALLLLNGAPHKWSWWIRNWVGQSILSYMMKMAIETPEKLSDQCVSFFFSNSKGGGGGGKYPPPPPPQMPPPPPPPKWKSARLIRYTQSAPVFIQHLCLMKLLVSYYVSCMCSVTQHLYSLPLHFWAGAAHVSLSHVHPVKRTCASY